ncbi:tetratricopeptide repeat protein 23 isoform X2 [Kogia breviceps]|uniref:tetratricopeptide repeat protein 23 isoform X2 n=1 Tax=Kogia breviceps TaxID=27615 RepID=UPI0034D160A9
MQESQETHISNHLDENVAAVSITPSKKLQNKLPQTALFQPPREKLHLCEEKAKSYSSSHEYKQALQELVRCVALTRICYGDSHWKLAKAHVNLAQGYLQLKGLSLQAKQHAEKAKEILTNSIVCPYNDNTDVFKCSVELFHTMGRALLSLQKFKEASENLTKAERLSKELLQCGRIIKEEWIEIQMQIKLSFAQKQRGKKRSLASSAAPDFNWTPSRPAVAHYTFRLFSLCQLQTFPWDPTEARASAPGPARPGGVYQGQKKSKEALPHYQEALEYIEISKGEKSLECVPTLRELAGVEQALGLHNASINHLLQAHLIVLSRNPSQEEAAVSAHSVACAAVASGRPEHHDVAEQYFQDSMANLKDAEGIGKAKFLSIQDDYCHFLQVTGQKERATSILRESLEVKVAVFGDLSTEVAETYRLLGGADLAQGNQSRAHKKLKKCLQIQTLLYGPQDKRTLATQQTMDVLSKAPEKAVKPRQPPRPKAAFCTGGLQHTMLGKARSNAAD